MADGDCDAEVLAVGSPADQAWRLLHVQPNVGWVIAGKLPARKRTQCATAGGCPRDAAPTTRSRCDEAGDQVVLVSGEDCRCRQESCR
ncbi:hypothetical protein [Streptomyces sp. NPDC055085]